MASHQTRHRGDIHFAFKQEFDGEKPLFLPSGLLSTVSFADPCCLVFLPCEINTEKCVIRLEYSAKWYKIGDGDILPVHEDLGFAG
jgi:hypothetical protein